ncbi:hypothetical protein MU858_21315 [Bacillus sp. PGP15]|uniref:hypothetical protein n=1 Tax=Bacillus sp. PGP15 TaxID=2933563 RepID=UPI002000F911|nr:hypothetical protein [Bacillus sp. PGP15]UPL43258.1 hypothetical protein MU858_21315 [Bacillus sp. PGP15]
MKPVQIYLGAPQTSKLPVYDVKPGQQVTVKQMIFTNTDATDAKITVTINTVDIMKDYVVKAGETQLISTNIVLNENNSLSLQQEKQNAINTMISGVSESLAL